MSNDKPNFARVKEILDKATGTGAPDHDGKAKFWNSPLTDLLQIKVYGIQVIVAGKPADSGLIKAIRGLAPFDGSDYERMPQGRPAIPDTEIGEIERWIEAGCPE